MLKDLLLATLGIFLFPLASQAGEFLVFPTDQDLQDPGFLERPHAAQREADPRSDRCDVIFKGQIQKGDTERLHQVFGLWNDDGFDNEGTSNHDRPTLCFDSPGGNINEALAMARYLWDVSDVTTRITSDSRCESACVFPFLTGNYYEEGENQDQYFERVVEAGGKLGLHAPNLNLTAGTTYNDQQVSGAFRLALKAASEVYSYGFQTDSWGEPFMGPYMFARFLETPPEEMYRIDTVGDALLSGIPVIDYYANSTASETLVRTVCDNAFMMDDGMFLWVLGAKWKSDAMLAASDVLREFNQLGVADTLEYDYDAEQYVTRPQTVLSEVEDGTLYGTALSYPSGYPWTFTGCAVRTLTNDRNPTLFHVDETSEALEPTYFFVEVMTFTHFVLAKELPDGVQTEDLDAANYADVLAPSDLWHQLEAKREKDPDAYIPYRKFPWLISYPFNHKLSELNTSVPPPAQSANLTCDELWYQRNLIFHENGYCFQGARGKSTFGNDGCYADAQTISLTPEEKADVQTLKQRAKDQGC